MGGERQRGGRGEGEWAELFEWDRPMGGQECRSEWGDGRGGGNGWAERREWAWLWK